MIKKEGVLKRLKNIEDINKVENKVKNKDIIEVTDFVDQPLNSKAKELINEIKTIQKMLITENLKLEVVPMLILILVITKTRLNYWSIGCFKSLFSKR